MGHARRDVEDGGTENELNCGGLAQGLSKNVAAFYPCPEHLPEAQLKSLCINSFVEETSR